MTDKSTIQRDHEQPVSAVKDADKAALEPYAAPKLTFVGTFGELTQGGKVNGNDSPGHSKN